MNQNLTPAIAAGMASDEVLLERSGAVATITLNRPARMNAVTLSLLGSLLRTLEALDEQPDVRAIVLTGAGRAFSAGADLQEPVDSDVDMLRQYGNPLILALSRMCTPVIAAVNGVAAGVGVSIALACDLCVASESASFEVPFVKLGLVPDGGITWWLPRLIGSTRAGRMLLLGRPLEARDALACGLVNEVVPADRTLSRALELARELAEASSLVGVTRRLLCEGAMRTLEEQLEAEAEAQAVALKGPEFAEARQAFARRTRSK